MKKILILVAAAISLSACQKVKNLANIGFDIPYSQSETLPNVPGYTYGMQLPAGGVELPFPPATVATNAQHYFDQYHASSKNIVSAALTSMSMQITAPAGQYFDFLDTIELYVSTESQPEVLVAYAYNIPKGQTTLDLTTMPGLNLKNYFVQDSIIVRLNAHINAVPAPGTTVQLSGKFHIVANPL